MMVKLTRLNRNGEEREVIFNTDDVLEITEIDGKEKVIKYDETTGEPVETKVQRRFVVKRANLEAIVLDETNKDLLVDAIA